MACHHLILNSCGFSHRTCCTLHLLGRIFFNKKYLKTVVINNCIYSYYFFFRLQYANSKAFKEFFWKVAGVVLCIILACIVSYSRYIIHFSLVTNNSHRLIYDLTNIYTLILENGFDNIIMQFV